MLLMLVLTTYVLLKFYYKSVVALIICYVLYRFIFIIN